jgi:uncharacterized membrane protein
LQVAILAVGFPAGIFFIVCEKYNRYIRFWAFQTVFVDAIFFLIQVICTIGIAASEHPGGWYWTNFIAMIMRWVIALFLSWHAYHGARTGILFKLPVLGQIALSQALNAASPPPTQTMQML